uniref:Uncharacterized protein n=1 Tax=Arundo donax TaxID=35708 RepID=A0A0A9CJH2_ARUDO
MDPRTDLDSSPFSCLAMPLPCERLCSLQMGWSRPRLEAWGRTEVATFRSRRH